MFRVGVRRRSRLVVGGAVGLLLLTASITFLVLASSEPSCANELLDRIPSPERRFYAFVFSRNCGATTGDNIQVSLSEGDFLPDEPGNVAITDNYVEYSRYVAPEWKDENTLIVRIPATARVYKKVNSVGKTSIEYTDVRH
jgi:hypothetical protein